MRKCLQKEKSVTDNVFLEQMDFQISIITISDKNPTTVMIHSATQNERTASDTLVEQSINFVRK